MKVAVCTLAYREEETIGAVLKNWRGRVDRHLVLETLRPWHGEGQPKDRTEEIAIEHGAEYVTLPWKSEHEQRNWGLAALRDCDYVLQVDADELYTEKDQEAILSRIGSPRPFEDNQDCYRIPSVLTYFKSTGYVLDPPDRHQPVVAVRPNAVLFVEARIPDTQYQIPVDGTTMHHLSYVKSDEKIWHKFRQFEHHALVKRGWFSDVWKQWTPEMEDVRAYGRERSRAVERPLPAELEALLHG